MSNVLENHSHLNDIDLIGLIQQNQDYLGIVYKRCKGYSIKFMRNITGNKMDEYELEDVFHDAVLVLYEKIIKGNFVLTASIQTYLNSVCRFQLLTKLKQINTLNIVDGDGNSKHDSSITDQLDEIIDEKESQFTAIENALLKMKDAGGHCYELLTLFWYHKKSMNELTTVFGYTNEVNTRVQKSKCQKRLEKMAFSQLNSY
jgi:hypothetical protein